MKTVTSGSSGTFLLSPLPRCERYRVRTPTTRGLASPLASLDSPDMTSPAGPAGPPVARVNHQADLLAALSEARLGRAMPVVVLIGGAGGLGDADAEAWLPLVRDGVMRPAADLGGVVVDGGTDAGIMALAGRARREVSESVGLVGVAPRGRVAAGNVNGGGQTALESNHSLVLLVPGDE